MTKCHDLNSKDSYNDNNVLNNHTPLLTGKDTPYTEIKDIVTPENKYTPTPLQASDSLGLKVEGGILTNKDTPLLTGKDTNILRVNNINNNIRAREFDEPSYVINLVNNKSVNQ